MYIHKSVFVEPTALAINMNTYNHKLWVIFLSQAFLTYIHSNYIIYTIFTVLFNKRSTIQVHKNAPTYRHCSNSS